MLIAAAADEGLRAGLVATAFGFGLRHGVDWDHIAAITDITSSQETPRRSMSLATLYAAGHALVVFLLGALAVAAGDLLPDGVDAVMERFVGATLVLLGVYVFYSLARHGRDFRMRSRWMLLLSGGVRGLRWARARARRGASEEIEHEHPHDHGPAHRHGHGDAIAVADDDHGTATVVTARGHRHPHRHRGTLPEDPFTTYGRLSAFTVGTIHGVGAETPTQVVLFLAAARAGGTAAGLLLLGAFVVGLLASNTVVAAVSTVGFLNATRSFVLYATVAAVCGVASIALGSLFLLGRGGVLPAILGG